MSKQRAVIYNRCSTEEEAQKDALLKQVRESRDCVFEAGWELVDTYVEAKSGTTAKGRNEYNRLYEDLGSAKFDIIVIKSQDRLMRNTKDWYLFLERMQRYQKRLYMYLERKFYTPDDALITGIKAILAEEYSRELSKKINNAHKNRQKEGKSFVFTNQTYGYRKMPDKSIAVEEKEAEMIRMIFELSASGYGTHCSAEILYRHGYRNHKGKRLGPSLIRNMIRNPIYKGTIVQNRQHYDFESKRVYKNPPSEWLFHENAVPRIVEDELFERANQGLDQRKQEGNRGGIYMRGSSPGKYDLSGKLICGFCKSPFYRTVRQNKNGKVTEWKCSNYLQNGRKSARMRREQLRKAGGWQPQPAEEGDERPEEGDADAFRPEEGDAGRREGCDNVHLDEKKLYGVLEQLCNRKYQNLEKDSLLKETLSILRKALSGSNTHLRKEGLENSLEKIIRQKDILLEKLLEGVISDIDFKAKNEELESRKSEVEKELKAMEEALIQNTRLESRIESIRKKLEDGLIRQAQIADMVSNISRIEVFPAYMEVYFDSRALTGLGLENVSPMVRDETDRLTAVRVDQTCSTSHRPMAEAEKGKILSLMREKPETTAKEIAAKMDVNLSLIHRRIRELKKEGKVRYSSRGGRGKWQILVPFQDKT